MKTLVYEASWSCYEESGDIQIYEDDQNRLWVLEGNNSVYAPGEPYWKPEYEVTLEYALELIEEWTEIEKQNEEYWSRNGY